MPTYFVSRHTGAVEWAKDQGIDAALIPHLDPANITAGDVVLGVLPIQLVAEINARGARYFNLNMTVPEAVRGGELTAHDMRELGAELAEYEARRINNGERPWSKNSGS